MNVGLHEDTRSSRRHTRPRPPARFDLSLSENPFAPLPSVLAAVRYELGRGNRYPEFLPARLPELIARRVGVGADQVVVGSGATGVAMQIIQSVASGGGEIVTSTPTFDGYPILAEMAGLRLVPVELDAAGGQDLRGLLRSIDKSTAVVVLCRPHNPTGTVLTAGELKGFLGSAPQRVTVILDEAYAEFLAPADRLDTLALLRRHPNLLILRTFSKAYGLAGLRIGYAFGRRELVTRVRRLQLPFGVPTHAVAAVAASYAAESELAARVRAITTDREHLRAALLPLGLTIPRSHANFLYLPGPGTATTLRRAGITAKSYPNGSARITVGDPTASRAVLAALTGRG
ncbi:aminotransferase class I/II-fold pyridoxal phosphate-dependent enzyme [Nocardia puris]|uniref:aminotransferase class I/II-fold pyridoxal phosphate-dependent enzyme n=1 Tax=Nocardia puris TaxID=208602 RepID=UPI001893C931|nr:aminotransferase class I/II-fold pyridoxal phosphate-dependent enzyme [Nocardia puris]MBF6213499.1 aminotransferase class I/II-fold pyridoxal phosphate-dependent enzyme [Nocardia puris]MBF6365571.1 aminotransferase class I/II-fold pyridoxal phosphate-dependent enzyme [Nocardia puris]MBF6460037.1 aminotransferase class I/II-fold pyridoxal phosphate-dependent enzyme [Nocardia puris]